MAEEVNVEFNEENWKQKWEKKKEEKYVKKRKITKDKKNKIKIWKEKVEGKNEKEYIKENLKNKEHVCYPPLDFSKKSIMNLFIYGKRRRMKWVIK